MSNTTNQLDLAALEALANAATPGPWEMLDGQDVFQVDGDQHICALKADFTVNAIADGDFIAAARNAVPALIAIVRGQRARMAELEAENARLSTPDTSVIFASGGTHSRETPVQVALSVAANESLKLPRNLDVETYRYLGMVGVRVTRDASGKLTAELIPESGGAKP
jgi:hypothetical protein